VLILGVRGSGASEEEQAGEGRAGSEDGMEVGEVRSTLVGVRFGKGGRGDGGRAPAFRADVADTEADLDRKMLKKERFGVVGSAAARDGGGGR
jgi:hypothetical protein